MITQYISLEHQYYNIVILCGGLGTRLGAQSQHIPKAMSDIGGAIAIDVLIEQFQHVANKYVVGTATHAHLLQSHIRGSFPQYPIEYSREEKPVNVARSFLYAMDHVDSRYPTVLTYCDAIQLGDPVLKPDMFYLVDKSTRGHTNTYKAGLEYGSVVQYEVPQNTGQFPLWTFSDTILLKRLVYSNPDVEDVVDIIKLYHNEKPMKTNTVKLCLEFGTEADLVEVRRQWELI